MVFKYRRGGGRGVKEKNQVSANDAAKVVGVYTTIEEPGLSLGGTMIKKGSENKGDKKKITTSVDDPAKDENGANKATNRLDQNVSPPVIDTLSYARAMINLRTDKELKDSIMVAMPKLVGRGFNMCTVKNKREKDKIETKPDQIKKKREAWLSQEKSRAVSVDRARKTEENTKRMVENART
nr:hypothetical protein [Tanacetum cinerariifolium]